MKNETDVRDHFKEAAADASKIGEAIRDYLRFAVAPPLAVLLLQRASGALVETANAIGDLLTPDEAPAVEEPASHVEAKRARASGEHRHKFGPDNRCTVAGCGKVKSANGRKPAAAPPPTAGERTLPLPATGKRSALLRPCMCTHPFSDHDDANAGGGACAMCTCEMFEEPVTHANVGRLPVAPLGDAAADRFAGGSQGSSGVVRR